MSEQGFKDPDEVYPLPEYQGKPTTNKAAREEWEPYVKLPDGAAGAELIKTDFQPKYPYNKVEESPTGHRIEIDDTPEAPRMSYAHNSGTGVEMYPDGTLLVNSHGRTVQLTGDDFTMIVNGNGNVTYKGNLNLNVEGDFNINCANFTVNGAGRNVTETRQTKVENYTADRIVTTKGTRSDIVVGNRIIASGKNTYIASGKRTKIASGDNMHIMAGDNLWMTAEDDMNLSATNARMTGLHVAVAGDSGTIGGDNVVMYAKSLHTDTIDATTIRADGFVGDLKGDVQGGLLGVASSAIIAGDVDSDLNFASPTPSVTEISSTTTAEPNRLNLTEALTKTRTVGIRNVDVDDGKLNSTVTGGISVANVGGDIGVDAVKNRPDIYGSVPPNPEGGAATERFNNPGGLYPASWQEKYGTTGTGVIGDGHLIQGFTTAEGGASAQMALLKEGKYYRNVPITEAIATWSGGNNVDAYLTQLRAQGIDTTKNVSFYTATKQGTIDLAKAMAYHEKGGTHSLSDEGWSNAYDNGEKLGWI